MLLIFFFLAPQEEEESKYFYSDFSNLKSFFVLVLKRSKKEMISELFP